MQNGEKISYRLGQKQIFKNPFYIYNTQYTQHIFRLDIFILQIANRGKFLITSSSITICLLQQFMFSSDSRNHQSEQRQDYQSGFQQKEAQRFENVSQHGSSLFKNSQFKEPEPKKRGEKRRRGRPSRADQMQKYKCTQGPFISESKKRKMQVIQAYETALQKLRASCTQFYLPFERHNLKLDKIGLLKSLKDAKQKDLIPRPLVRSVGVRHERNLFKYGVKEQLNYITNYLETGTIPKWMKQHFEQLLQKDFSDTAQTTMYPYMV